MSKTKKFYYVYLGEDTVNFMANNIMVEFIHYGQVLSCTSFKEGITFCEVMAKPNEKSKFPILGHFFVPTASIRWVILGTESEVFGFDVRQPQDQK